MSITVIRIGMFEEKSKDAMKPLIFGILDELTDGEDMCFLDDRVESLPPKINSPVIAMSVDTFSARRAYQLAKQYKTRDNIIVMGGFHPTVCPEEAGLHCDVVLMGDAEDTWPFFLSDWREGKVKPVYNGAERSIGKEIFPGINSRGTSRRPYAGKSYLKLGILQYSRGCKFNCDFCSIKAMYPGGVKRKSLSDLVEEIGGMKERLLFFADDNLFTDETSARELFLALKPLGKKWSCQISLEIAEKHEMLSLMKDCGCVLVLIGFESLNGDRLKQMNKRANLNLSKDDLPESAAPRSGDSIAVYERAIERIYRHGIMIYGTFVCGYDGDSRQDVELILKFACDNRLAVANFNPLIPMPGTTLYGRLQREGRLLYDGRWWLYQGYCYGDTAFLPAGMTPEELKTACRFARYSFYSTKSILKRLVSLPLHMKLENIYIYLLLNVISAVEVRRKQGKILGGMVHETDAGKT